MNVPKKKVLKFILPFYKDWKGIEKFSPHFLALEQNVNKMECFPWELSLFVCKLTWGFTYSQFTDIQSLMKNTNIMFLPSVICFSAIQAPLNWCLWVSDNFFTAWCRLRLLFESFTAGDVFFLFWLGLFPSAGATVAHKYVTLGFSSVFLEKEQYQYTAKSVQLPKSIFLMETSVGLLMSCWDSFTSKLSGFFCYRNLYHSRMEDQLKVLEMRM